MSKKKFKLVASALAVGAGVAAVNAVRKKNGSQEGQTQDKPQDKGKLPPEREQELK